MERDKVLDTEGYLLSSPCGKYETRPLKKFIKNLLFLLTDESQRLGV